MQMCYFAAISVTVTACIVSCDRCLVVSPQHCTVYKVDVRTDPRNRDAPLSIDDLVMA